LIAFGAVAEAAGLEAPVIAFLGDPVFALFLGLLGAYLLAWRTLTKERVEEAMGNGFNATGQILLITGIGGSLGAVIGETGLDKILGELFSAEAGTPALLTILLAWFIAAVLHLAIGSISVATITAAGILAPIMGSIEVPASVSRSATTALSFATHRNSPVWSSNAKLAASPLTLTPRWKTNCTGLRGTA
jgi:H+/gluconate symporter-like permease